MKNSFSAWKRVAVSVTAVWLGVSVRIAPAFAQYRVTNLIADQSGPAPNVDPLLIDPWGLVMYHGQFVVADPGAEEIPGGGGGGAASFYMRRGTIARTAVTVPAAPSFGNIPGSPTGVVVNPSNDFVISKGGRSAPAELIFDTLDGTISAWSPKVDPDNATIVIDNSTRAPNPASYTALAIARSHDGHYILYAVDSGISPTQSNNEIAMYDGNFNQVGHFSDPDAPTNMTAFGLQEIQQRLYVTYAAFAFIRGGVVDVFDLQGNLISRFASNGPEGPLEEPWAIALAPQSFGPKGGTLLVGDVSDGLINAYDPKTGSFLGRLESSPGNAISLAGLWSLLFDGDQLFFTDGPSFPPNSGVFADGLFGVITAQPGARERR